MSIADLIDGRVMMSGEKWIEVVERAYWHTGKRPKRRKHHMRERRKWREAIRAQINFQLRKLGEARMRRVMSYYLLGTMP